MTPLLVPLLVPLHGIGSRRDLPLPLELVVAGAAVTLLVTFALVTVAWRRPRFVEPRGMALPRLTALVDHPVVRWGARAVVAFVWLWFAMALVWGKDQLTNPVFGWVFVLLWVGLVPTSLLGGHLVRETHPAWSLGSLLRRRPLPARVGIWPAAAAVLVFAFLELVQPERATLPVLRAYVAAYWLWLLGGTAAWGRDWVRAADPLSAYADLVTRVSPWQRIDGTLHLVDPLRHAATARVPRGTVGLVAALLGATAMDSWTGGQGWTRWVQSSGTSPVLAGTGALLLCVGVVAATLSLAAWWLGRRSGDPRGVADDVAATCAPIVAGYALAHYATLLVLEGQRTLVNASDPLGRRWNAFGTAELGVSTLLVSLPWAVAVAQVLFVVGGHVVGVLVAHDRALRRLRPESRVVGQLPLLVVMVGYTLAGLLLLFSA